MVNIRLVIGLVLLTLSTVVFGVSDTLKKLGFKDRAQEVFEVSMVLFVLAFIFLLSSFKPGITVSTLDVSTALLY